MTRGSITRAAAYCRISRDKEGLALGVERQRADCLSLIERNGWTIVHDGENDTFTDNDISGAKDFTERVALGRLVKAIEAGKVDAVVAYSQARIYRDTAKFLEFCELCKTAGVETVALVADADVNPSGSLFIATIIAAKDAEERRRVGELVERKMLEKAQAGQPHGGPRPFGYLRVKGEGRLVVDEVEAALIREAVQKVLEGVSIWSICEDWNARGVKPSRGSKFYRPQVKKILTSERLAGLRRYQGEILEGVEVAWDPIIDRETWERVCTILNNPARTTPPASLKYPLKGMMICAECEKRLVAVPHHGKPQYGCVKAQTGGCGGVVVKAEHIEKFIFDLILPMADSPDLRDILAAEEQGGAEAFQELVLANAEDEKMRAQIVNDYTDGVMPRPLYLKQLSKLNERIESRKREMENIGGKTALSHLGGDVQSHWDGMTPEDRRSILKSIVDHIVVGKAKKPGSRYFDPDRVKVAYRTAAIQKMVSLYKGADGGWRIPTILFTTDPKQPLPETLTRGRLLSPDEIKQSKKKGQPVPKSRAS